MKIKTGFLLGLAFMVTACPQKGEMLWKDTYWVLEEIQGESIKTDLEARPIYFHLPEGPDGKVEGFAGCNQFFGSCKVEKQNMRLSRLAATKVMCPRIETERAFLSALEQTESYRWKGKRLRLVGNGAVLAVFAPSGEKEVKKGPGR